MASHRITPHTYRIMYVSIYIYVHTYTHTSVYFGSIHLSQRYNILRNDQLKPNLTNLIHTKHIIMFKTLYIYICVHMLIQFNSYWYCKSEYQTIGTEQSRNHACEVQNCWGGHIFGEVQPVFTWEFQVGPGLPGLTLWSSREKYCDL